MTRNIFKKYNIISIICVIFIFSQMSNAHLTCDSLFADDPRLPLFGSLDFHYNLSVETSSYSLDTNQSGVGQLKTTSFYRSIPNAQLRTDIIEYNPSLGSKKELTTSTVEYSYLLNEFITFVTDNYKLRRHYWGLDYINSIKEDCFKFSNYSILFISRLFLDPKYLSSKIIGTLKIIKPNSTDNLPLEIEHNLSLPKNNGQKFEIGNFVVQKEFNEIAFNEVVFQLINFAKRLTENEKYEKDQPVFFIDADKASATLYKQLGFKKVQGFQEIYVKNGKSYALLGASAEDIINLTHIFKSQKKSWQGPYEINFLKLEQALLEYDISQADINGFSFSYVLTNGVHTNNEPLTVHVSKARETQIGWASRISIDQQNHPGLQVNYIIPSTETIQEGWTYESSNTQFNYKQGLLTISQSFSTFNDTLQIETDPNFRQITKVIYKKFKQGQLVFEILANH